MSDMERIPNRSGMFVEQKEGYKAFLPRSLPPPDDLDIDDDIQFLLSKADSALARLDGVTYVLPNPDLFVAMFIKKEALLSSQIEGTRVSLRGVLEFEANFTPTDDISQINEVMNYIKAMNYGLKEVKTTPISIDLLNSIHRILLEGARGYLLDPGKIRYEQNWIGSSDSILAAKYIPPPPESVHQLMQDLEHFIQSKDKIPPLIKIALIHAQFETIHPYLDGNGRMGRLLITFYLCSTDNLLRPLLYLSYYLKKNKDKYYDLPNNIRTGGDWESWIHFFLKGVIEVSNNAIQTAKRIIELKETTIGILAEHNIGSVNAVQLVDYLFDHPMVTASQTAKDLDISIQTAISLLGKFEKAKIVVETTGKLRYKKYVFPSYLKIIYEGTQG
jgi:Fic family protein